MNTVCFGCSFTWGLELEDPLTQSWPALLQAQNHGQCGASNQTITRLLLEHLATNRPDLVIIMWTYTHRFEFVLDNNNFISTHCDSSMSMDQRDIPTYFEKFRKDFFLNVATTDSHCLHTSLMAIHHAESSLKNMGIPYIFSRVSDLHSTTACHPRVQTLYDAYRPELTLIDNLSFEDYARKINSWGVSHPLIQAHSDIASVFQEKINQGRR